MNEKPSMLSISQAATESGIARYSLTAWAKSGVISAVRLGGKRGKVLINMDSLYNYLSTARLTDGTDAPQVIGGVRRQGVRI